MAPDLSARVREVALKHALQNALQHGSASVGAVMGRVMAEAPDLRAHAKEVPSLVGALVAEVNALSPEARERAFREVEGEIATAKREETKGPLKPLPNAEKGEVVMRFAPNPSGPFTLGHARGMTVNWAYKERYDGKIILRFDDTDTTVKPPMPEAYDWMPEDFEWLCGKPDEVVKASERMPHYYEWARKLLEAGGAYVDTCDPEAFRNLKNAGEACPHREQPLETNLELWEKMRDGGFRRGEAVLRVKTDIRHKDPALRDWVGFRIAEEPHPLVGEQYRAWPLLDFQSAVDDHLLGVTHVIRGKDLMDSTRKQEFLYKHLGWSYPETLYWGRVSVHEFGKFSKSILKDAIERGEYEGWDDPRLPTLRALKRRGFQAEAIRNFWTSFGLTEKDVAASIQTLEAENRKVVEPVANRYFFVPDPLELRITGADLLDAKAPLHPDHPDRGVREHVLSATEGRIAVLVPREDVEDADEGAKIRLKDLANLTLTTPGEARYEGDDLDWLKRERAKIIQWAPKDGVRVQVKLPEPGPDGKPLVHEGVGERQLLGERVGSIVQLERYGFCRVDEAGGEGVVLYFAHK